MKKKVWEDPVVIKLTKEDLIKKGILEDSNKLKKPVMN